jgi:hypothetical protein
MSHRLLSKALAFAALAVVALAPLAARAQQAQPSASHVAQARELVANGGISKSLEIVPAGMAEAFKRTFAVTRPEVLKDFDQVMVQLKPYFDQLLKEIDDIATKSIATRFSEAELKEINTFFKTPAGQKYISLFPVVLDDVSEAVEKWGQPKEREIIERIRSEMKKRGHTI